MFSVAGANWMLDQILGTGSPVHWYVGLVFSEPSEVSTGSTVNEPTAASYSRVAISNNEVMWPAAYDGWKTNADAVTFPEATEDWGSDRLRYVILTDDSSGGTLYMWGRISSVRVREGEQPTFPAGGLVFTPPALETT